MEQEVTIRIILRDNLPGVLIGLQSGSGSAYQTIQKQYSTENDLIFEHLITVKSSETKETPDYKGKIVHGPKGGRFVYIDIGVCAGELSSPWSRRLKIPLQGIAIVQNKKGVGLFQTIVPGKSRDGGPNCATVKPFPGWVYIST